MTGWFLCKKKKVDRGYGGGGALKNKIKEKSDSKAGTGLSFLPENSYYIQVLRQGRKNDSIFTTVF